MIKTEAEGPSNTNKGKLDQHQPTAARKQIAADFASGTARAVEKRGNAGEEDETRSTEMGDPARQEEGRLGHITRIKLAGGKKVARVIKRHHNHDQAA